MAFEKLDSFSKKVSDLADKPSLTPTALKAQFDAAPDEVRVYLNALIDALKKTTSGDSGAKNIGATSITGLTGSDVQTILGSLKTYTETLVGKKQAGQTTTFGVFAGLTYDIPITYNTGLFSTTPILTFSIFNQDIDGAAKVASTIVDNNKDTAKIRLKNNSSETQYMIVYWKASDK
jgi:hypothetical protein